MITHRNTIVLPEHEIPGANKAVFEPEDCILHGSGTKMALFDPETQT